MPHALRLAPRSPTPGIAREPRVHVAILASSAWPLRSPLGCRRGALCVDPMIALGED